MFIKLGTAVIAERVTAETWKNQVKPSFVRQDTFEKIAPLEFDLDTKNFAYYRARAVSAGEYYGPNDNGDYFPDDELQKSYQTFIGRGVYFNHNSDSVENACGIILDAVYHPKGKYVECLLAMDKINHPEIVSKIDNGIIKDVSMGAMVQECACSICGAKATTEDEYCFHLKNFLGKEFNGKKVSAINRGVNFYELSWVATGADRDAHQLEKIARKQENVFGTLEAHFNIYKTAKTKQGGQKYMGDIKERFSAKEWEQVTDLIKQELMDTGMVKEAQPPMMPTPPMTPTPITPPPSHMAPGTPTVPADPMREPKKDEKKEPVQNEIKEKVEKVVEKDVLEKAVVDMVKKVLQEENLVGKVERSLSPDMLREDVKNVVKQKMPNVDLETPAPKAAPSKEEKPGEKKEEKKPPFGKEKEDKSSEKPAEKKEEKEPEKKEEEKEASFKDAISLIIRKVMGKGKEEGEKEEGISNIEKPSKEKESDEMEKEVKDSDKKEDKGNIELGMGYGVGDAKLGKGTELVELQLNGKGLGIYVAKVEGPNAVETYKEKFTEVTKMKGTEKGIGEEKGSPVGLKKHMPMEINKPKEEDKGTMGNELKIKYEPAKEMGDFKHSYFIGTKGNMKVVASAEQLLSEDTRKKILASIKAAMAKKATSVSGTEVGAQSTSEKEYDITKGKIDEEMKEGTEPNQPNAKVKTPGAEVGTASTSNKKYDITKGKIDETIKIGDEPEQPEDLIKKYAEQAKGSIVALAKLWNVSIHKVASRQVEAKVAGEGNYAREEVKLKTKDTTDTKEVYAREDVKLDPSGPSGSKGSEIKKYYQGLNSATMSDEGGDQWARKVASLETENRILRARIKKQAEDATTREKGALVNEIMNIEVESGALETTEEEAIQLHTDTGLEMEAARIKAADMKKEAEKERLSKMDVASLRGTLETVAKFAGVERKVEGSASFGIEVPAVYRDEEPTSEEDKLMNGWTNDVHNKFSGK